MRKVFVIICTCMWLLPLFGQKTVVVKQKGTLRQQLTLAEVDTCSHLVIKGKLNSEDFRLLRYMAGGNTEGKGALRTLDLSEAKFANDENPILELDAVRENIVVAAQPVERRKWSSPSVYYFIERPSDGRTWSDVWASHGIVPGGLPKENMDGKILKYVPVLLLNNTYGNLSVSRKETDTYEENARFEALGVIPFWEDSAEELWNLMQRTRIKKFKGHKFTKEGSRYLLRTYPRKGAFSHEIFYGCPKIETVVLPRGTRLMTNVLDMKSRTKFYIGKELYDWRKDETLRSIRIVPNKEV